MNHLEMRRAVMALLFVLAFWVTPTDAGDIIRPGVVKIARNTGGFDVNLQVDSEFGFAVESLGDMDNDGFDEVAVSAPFLLRHIQAHTRMAWQRVGEIYILHLGPGPTLAGWQRINPPLSGAYLPESDHENLHFGTGMAAIGRIDGSPGRTLVVGGPGDYRGHSSTDQATGTIFLLNMNTSNQVESTIQFTAINDGFPWGELTYGGRFGTSVAALGDLDGDGIEEIAVGAPLDDRGGDRHGVVFIIFFNSDHSLKSYQTIDSSVGGVMEGLLADVDRFGTSLGGLGDTNNDGFN